MTPVTLDAPEPVPADWPQPPEPSVFQGLAGEMARMLSPYTEADPMAVLTQSLAVLGNQIGRGPHCRADGAYHALRLYVTLVGASSASRKGTSFAVVRELFLAADPSMKTRLRSGLSSGEGLIWHVRDASPRRTGKTDDGGDDGISDKRLIVVEPEFARCLKVLDRDGSTLSAVLREAWDTGTLHILTKNQAATATDTHITVIGHITRADLKRYLTATETANGFANRFLWLAVRRPQLLPEGAMMPEDERRYLVAMIGRIVHFGATVGEMTRDKHARELWIAHYSSLARPRPGLVGAVTSRAEAQTMRMACLYAIAGESAVVQRGHLESALALWDYFERCAGFIFGKGLGDPVADELCRELTAAGEQGLTRTELHQVLGRNVLASRLTDALELLRTHKQGYFVREESRDGGRPGERWFLPTAVVPACDSSRTR
jgi:hypothetical protein